MTPDETKHRLEEVRLALTYAAENRRAEISLVWTRAAYFWTFLVTATLAFGVSIQNHHQTIALVFACFACLCSLFWTLANRGGKYWQWVWEKKAEAYEMEALGRTVFSDASNRKDIPTGWLAGRRFSPSKLSIAASDLSVVIWILLIASVLLPAGLISDANVQYVRWAIFAATVAYAVAIFFICRPRVGSIQ